MQNFMAKIFLFFCFFPYLFPFGLNTDLQPYALIISILILTIYPIYINKTSLMYIIITIFAFIIFIISFFKYGYSFDLIRSLSNYVSLLTITLATYSILKNTNINIIKTIFIFLIINIIISLIQLLFYREFGYSLISQPRTSVARGVVGVASEPTFFAINLLFYALIAALYNHKNSIKIIILSILSIIFISQSTMVIFYLIIYLFLYIIIESNFKIKITSTVLICLILLMGLSLNFNSEYRIINVLYKIFNSPSNILDDISIHQRVVDIVFSVYGFITNMGVPHLWGHWGIELHEIVSDFSWANKPWLSLGNRIMSGYGAALYELGLIGGLYIFILIGLHKKIYKNNNPKFYVKSIFIILLMFSSVQLSNPLYSIYIGVLLFIAQNDSSEERCII